MDENLIAFIDLVQKYPEREVVCMVEQEVVGGDEYTRWQGYIGKSRLDEMFNDGECIHFKSKSSSESKSILSTVLEPNYIVEPNWKEVIVVNIDI